MDDFISGGDGSGNGNGNDDGDEAAHNDGVDKPNEMWDQIAAAIWTQYLEEHVHHGIPLHV